MQKKLIFLRKGQEELKDIEFNFKLYNIDLFIDAYGYNSAVYMLNNDKIVDKVDYLLTTCPTILSTYDKNHNPLWWNEEEYKWEIYFIEKGKLKNISEFTDKELRPAHNIANLYLNGGLG